MLEVHEAASVIQQAADPEANIIFGAVIDPEMGADVKITLIATGFDSVRRPPDFRPGATYREPTYSGYSQPQQTQAQAQPYQAPPPGGNGQSQQSSAQGTASQARPDSGPLRPAVQRPAQAQSGDELDIPPFLFPKFKK
jgi:cell division protein FtsZ